MFMVFKFNSEKKRFIECHFLMSERWNYQSKFINILFKNFIKKPAIILINKFAHSDSIDINLQIIQTKLDQNVYCSTFDFVIDIRYLIYEIKKLKNIEKDEILILDELFSWFEKKIHNIPINEIDYIKKTIKKNLKKIYQIEYSLSLRSFQENSLFNHTNIITELQIIEIQKYLKKLQDINQIQLVISLFNLHGYNINFTEKTNIPLENLSNSFLVELLNLLRKIHSK